MTGRHHISITLMAVFMVAGVSTEAQSKKRPARSASAKSMSKSAKVRNHPLVKSKNELIEKANEHKTNLEKELPFLEMRVREASEDLDKKRALFDAGLVAKYEIDDGEKALVAAQRALTHKRNEIEREGAQVDQFIAEALAAEKLASMPPPRLGGFVATAGLIRFNGAAGWSLSDVVKVEGFFVSRFNRPLPVSALGQTPTHDRMGFDHRNGIDVAAHPDSPEGQAIIAYLRSAGIPFLAFRGAVPGSATGPHIHIGYPSRRLYR